MYYWGIPREALAEANPPVVMTPSGQSGWEVESELCWEPSHTHLSSFLDDMTYLHAFSGGALHGGSTSPLAPTLPPSQIAWLEACWNKATVTAMGLSLSPDYPSDNLPSLYVRDGQAVNVVLGCGVVAREAEVFNDLAQRFQITWNHRW